MANSSNDFNVMSKIDGRAAFAPAKDGPKVNACFFMPCTDQGRTLALSLMSMFKALGCRKDEIDMSSAPSTKADLGRYEVNAFEIPQSFSVEVADFFNDALIALAQGTKSDPSKLGYGSGIHTAQDSSPPFRSGGPR